MNRQPMLFEYNYVEPKDLEVIYDRGIIRIRALNKCLFGVMRAPAPEKDVFEAYEIQIHTPSEHFM